MDYTYLYCVFGYIIILVIIVEYIYWRRYIPNMRRLAENDYRDL